MDASLFLTEVDIHNPKRPIGELLRAYIIKHYLFFDKLVVGDSQFNNNPDFRNLIWEREKDLPKPKCPQDLWKIVDEGILVPATRTEYNSLSDLRKEHISRKVVSPPSEEYVEFIDEKVRDQEEKYEINDVSIAFRERVLEALDDSKNVGRGKISKSSAMKVKDYVLRQEPLLFDSLRKWMKKEIESKRLTQWDYNRVDNLASGAYRHNVAIALDKNLDIPISKSQDTYPITITLGKPNRRKTNDFYEEINPTFILFPNILCYCPAEALIDIKKNCKYHKRIVKTLERFRLNKKINFNEFVTDLEYYLAEIELRFNFFLESKQQNIIFNDIIQEEKKKYYENILPKSIPKTVIRGISNVGISILGFIPFSAEVINTVGFVNAAHGAIRNIRDAMNPTGLDGHICGRSDSLHKIYEVIK